MTTQEKKIKCKIVWFVDRHCYDCGGDKEVWDDTPWEEVSLDDFDFLRKWCTKLYQLDKESYPILIKMDDTPISYRKRDILSILESEKKAEEKRKAEAEQKKLEKELKKKAKNEQAEKELLKQLKEKYGD